MTPKTNDPDKNPPRLLTPLFGLGKAEVDTIEVLGFELYQQGRTHEADIIFGGLIAIDSKRYQGYAGKGALALAEERLDEAVTWLSQALERNDTDAAVHANLGETLLRLGRFEAAAAELAKALALDPENKQPAANRARAILMGMKMMMNNLESEQQPKPDSDK